MVTNWLSNGARTPDWTSFMLDELLPKVSRSFAICPQRRYHAIAGASMGGYGATYLASQRPDYFGNVGSFSGTVNISSPDLEYGLSGYSDIWGPPGGFYELGHNPTQLIDNFRYTRVFMAVGNGQPLAPGDSSQQLAALAESELRREAADFRAAARSAHVDVHFVEHAGVHLQNNANLSLQDFLRYGPWRPTANSVATWRLSTVEQSGIAWGYHFSFARAPATIETFSYGGDTLTAAGSGDVALTSPTGRRYRASLPFTVSNGILHPGHGGSKSFAPTSCPSAFACTGLVGSRGAIQATFTSRRAPAGRIFVLLAFRQSRRAASSTTPCASRSV